MLNIFNSGNILLNKFSLVTNSNLDKILFSQLILFKNFMLDEDFFAPNNDPLVQLINDAMPHDYVNLIDEEIVYNIKNRIEYVANVIGMTSNRNKGRYFKNNNLTYCILLEEDIDIKYDDDYDIVKVVYTDYDSVDFSYNTEVKEFMVILLNPMELILSYIKWKHKRKQEDRISTYSVFVATVVRPKFWESKINQVIFNRFMKLYNGLPVTPYKNKHSIQLINRDDLLDSELRRFIKLVKNNPKLEIRTFLYSFNFIGNNMLDILNYNQRTFLTGTNWVFYLTRVKYVVFLLNMIKDNKSEAINNEHIKILHILMRRYDNGLFTMIELPKHIREEFLTNVKKIKEMISYR